MLTHVVVESVKQVNKVEDTPHFYMWLEDPSICTGNEKELRSVSYGERNRTW